MSYKWILFDLDNTLIDFTNASKLAFEKICPLFGIQYNDIYYETFSKINHQVWRDFEQDKITLLDLRARRFNEFFAEIGINSLDGFDANEAFISEMIAHTQPYENVHSILENLGSKIGLSVITNGLRELSGLESKKRVFLPFLKVFLCQMNWGFPNLLADTLSMYLIIYLKILANKMSS